MAAKIALDAYCTLIQASRITGYSPQHMRYLADTGKIGMIRDPGSRRLLFLPDVRNLAKERMAKNGGQTKPIAGV